ncbi:MAG: IclR family transcriptional regulator [Dehalococcoidales bacterium]|nr:IclR family transcriptional regulator [Dehalococcoidales bacterium]
MEKKEKYSAPSVETAARILLFLKEANEVGATFSQICRGVGIPKSTGFNILKTLQEVNFVEFDPETRYYSLGWALVELGGSAANRLGHLTVVRSYLKPFVREAGLTGYVMQRLKDRYVIVERIDAPSGVRVSASVGESHPIWFGAQGRVFLAFASEEEINLSVTPASLKSYTPNAITDPDAYKNELARIRKNGWAYSDEEYVPGVRAVAAPVFDSQGELLLVISAMGFTSFFTADRVDELGFRIKEIADKISEAISGRRESRVFA